MVPRLIGLQFLRKHELYDGQPPGLLARHRFGMCDFVNITCSASERGRGDMRRHPRSCGCDQMRSNGTSQRLRAGKARSQRFTAHEYWLCFRVEKPDPQLISSAETAPNGRRICKWPLSSFEAPENRDCACQVTKCRGLYCAVRDVQRCNGMSLPRH